MTTAALQKLKQEIKLELFQEFILPIMQEEKGSQSVRERAQLADALAKIARGDQEFKDRRTKVVSSPRELL